MQIVDNFLLNLAIDIELKFKNPNTLQMHSVISCRKKKSMNLDHNTTNKVGIPILNIITYT